ncbi:non-hydrolyzing UDP-N-acetylglucosamine 2-epimerase [Pseudokineococcus sp. 1T1Z-3]|uniref:non-hydrolyzing UDP-N-acetylglucosamine 2-epimerase n=1 Tax=Pseudokineococcus sp. 1T1Z-3 TaxID=3132745 RepID=UPI0030B5D110
MRPVVHVVGARPNFVKAAPVLAALRDLGVEQRLVHTGQHYDAAMSDVFFADLQLPAPEVSLGVGSGTHARQTAALMTGLEDAFADLDPALIVGYGDVNSTLAAALVTSKTGVPLAHVEAGLRSFDPTMPEEVNRRVVDALSDVLLATSPEALAHLADEGLPASRMHLVGNTMIDSLLLARERLDPAGALQRLGLDAALLETGYAVATLHRPANVDDPATAARLVRGLAEVAADVPVVFPLHPRGGRTLRAGGVEDVPGLTVTAPLGYGDFLSLVSAARLVVTDSGGLQEETTVLGVPCLTLRPNTERPITITSGTNRLVDVQTLAAAAREALAAPPRPPELPPLWDGRAGPRAAAVIARFLADHA